MSHYLSNISLLQGKSTSKTLLKLLFTFYNGSLSVLLTYACVHCKVDDWVPERSLWFRLSTWRQTGRVCDVLGYDIQMKSTAAFSLDETLFSVGSVWPDPGLVFSQTLFFITAVTVSLSIDNAFTRIYRGGLSLSCWRFTLCHVQPLVEEHTQRLKQKGSCCVWLSWK